MKKFTIYTLFLSLFAIGFTSCQKDDIYRPGGPNSELNAEGDGSDENPDDLIVDPDDPTGKETKP
jgi:hypothetical protein